MLGQRDTDLEVWFPLQGLGLHLSFPGYFLDILWALDMVWAMAGGDGSGRASYLHGDIGCLYRHTLQTLITAAAGTASQGDTGWAEYVCHLIGVLIHNLYQLLHWPAVAAAPYFIEGHHCRETEGPDQVSRQLLLDGPALASGSICTKFSSSRKLLALCGLPLL